LRRDNGSSYKPLFEYSDASETSLIEEFPLGNEIRRFLKRERIVEGLHDIDECLLIFRIFGSVARKMDVDTSPAKLRTEIAERQ